MALDYTTFRTDFDAVVGDVGFPITVRQGYTYSYSGTDYDEAYLSSGANVSGSGMAFPLGNSDKGWVAQGLLKADDQKLFVAGSLGVVPEAIVTFGGSTWGVLPQGIQKFEIGGSVVYQKCYIRLMNGSPGYL